MRLIVGNCELSVVKMLIVLVIDTTKDRTFTWFVNTNTLQRGHILSFEGKTSLWHSFPENLPNIISDIGLVNAINHKFFLMILFLLFFLFLISLALENGILGNYDILGK